MGRRAGRKDQHHRQGRQDRAGGQYTQRLPGHGRSVPFGGRASQPGSGPGPRRERRRRPPVRPPAHLRRRRPDRSAGPPGPGRAGPAGPLQI
ncbi:hypothetical protein ATKI12_0146 [Kitasatospora sp. Ki12]